MLLFVPHNMTVESGFSRMKFAESDYKSSLSHDLYDGIRLASDYFDRETLEKYEVPAELLRGISQASRFYTSEERKKFKARQIMKQEGEEVKRTIGIYKRKPDQCLRKEIQETETEIQLIQKQLEGAQARKRRLEEDCKASKKRRDDVLVSNKIIQFFRLTYLNAFFDL